MFDIKLTILSAPAMAKPVQKICTHLTASRLIRSYSWHYIIIAKDGNHGSLIEAMNELDRVFTPFSRAWRTAASRSVIVPIRVPQSSGPTIVPSSTITLNCEKRDSQQWPAGEQVATEMLNTFVDSWAGDYQEARDFPTMDNTSRLSPYLAIGVLSPRQCVAALLSRYPDATPKLCIRQILSSHKIGLRLLARTPVRDTPHR